MLLEYRFQQTPAIRASPAAIKNVFLIAPFIQKANAKQINAENNVIITKSVEAISFCEDTGMANVRTSIMIKEQRKTRFKKCSVVVLALNLSISFLRNAVAAHHIGCSFALHSRKTTNGNITAILAIRNIGASNNIHTLAKRSLFLYQEKVLFSKRRGLIL
jgi:hypothetical protein